jgi:hypothetical protein
MDPDELHAMIQLKDSIHLHLSDILGGVAWGVQRAIIWSTLEDLHILPGFLLGIAQSYLLKITVPFIYNDAALWSEQYRDDYRLQRGYAMSKSRQYLQVGFRIMFLFATFFYLSMKSFWLDVPLNYAFHQPAWPIWLAYRALLSYVTLVFTPLHTLEYTGPSLIPTFVALLVYPLQLLLKWRRRWLSATFVAPLKGGQILPKYSHAPIIGDRRFRLLRLRPKRGRILATLEEADAETCPPYWAVSYVWGSEERTHSLAVLSADGERGYLSITKSCAKVLGLLTPLNKERYLWIDAICVNQDDLTDKESQIPLMATIYSSATQVVGCLFPPEFWYFIYLGQNFITEVSRFPRATVGDEKVVLPIRWRLHDWHALIKLSHDPYWERIWIIQEICLARNLVFIVNDPYTCFTWDQFYPTIKNLYNLLATCQVQNVQSFSLVHPSFYLLITALSDRLDMLSDMKSDIQSENRADWPLLANVVDRLYKAQSTNPRDQIFGLLSLASDGDAPELRPIYDLTTTSHREVLSKAAAYFLGKGQVHFLLLAGLGHTYEGCDRPVPDLPSWVPVLPKPHRPRVGNRAAARAKARICNLEHKISDDYRILSVQGAIVDEIVAVVKNPLVMEPLIVSHHEESSDSGARHIDKPGTTKLTMPAILTKLPDDFVQDLIIDIPRFLINIGLAVSDPFAFTKNQKLASGENRSPEAEQGFKSAESLMMDICSSLDINDPRRYISTEFPGLGNLFDTLVLWILAICTLAGRTDMDEPTQSTGTDFQAAESRMMRILGALGMSDSRQQLSSLFPGTDDILDSFVSLVLPLCERDGPEIAAKFEELVSSVSTAMDGPHFNHLWTLLDTNRLLDRDGGGHNLLHHFCYHFAVTAAGRFAWVIPGSQAGDKICFLNGLDELPLLLRRETVECAAEDNLSKKETFDDEKTPEKGNFMLVGEAWVQDLRKELDLEYRWLRLV